MNRGVGGDIISLTNFIHYRTNTRSNSSMFRISKIAGIFILMTILLMSYSTAKVIEMIRFKHYG